MSLGWSPPVGTRRRPPARSAGGPDGYPAGGPPGRLNATDTTTERGSGSLDETCEDRAGGRKARNPSHVPHLRLAGPPLAVWRPAQGAAVRKVRQPAQARPIPGARRAGGVELMPTEFTTGEVRDLCGHPLCMEDRDLCTLCQDCSFHCTCTAPSERPVDPLEEGEDPLE